MYETELLEQFADTESAAEFFALLDFQLNKVNQFFRTKEKEFFERGECLKKQMEILVELKDALIKQQYDKGTSSGQNIKEDELISATISCGNTATPVFTLFRAFFLCPFMLFRLFKNTVACVSDPSKTMHVIDIRHWC